MCQPRRHWLADYLANLQAPIPLPRKVWLVVRNLSRRAVSGEMCCGHAGEPGC